MRAVERSIQRYNDVDVLEVDEDITSEEHTNQSRGTGSEADFAPLLKRKEAEQFRAHWLEIQSRFVDDPNVSVKEADELVKDVIQHVVGAFANQRTSLETQWKNGGKASTEDLRLALKKYRSFFNRLLTLES